MSLIAEPPLAPDGWLRPPPVRHKIVIRCIEASIVKSDHDEVIREIRRAREEEVRFFSNAGKTERERWVVSEFLTQLGVRFGEEGLFSPRQNDPVDVIFRDARFQVKEIKDPGVPRNDEVKADLRRALSASRLEDLFAPVEGRDIELSNASVLMLNVAASPRFPPSVRQNLDLVFYVTRPYSGLGSAEDREGLARAGWRSASCLFGAHPLVFAANADAPSFLRC